MLNAKITTSKALLQGFFCVSSLTLEKNVLEKNQL